MTKFVGFSILALIVSQVFNQAEAKSLPHPGDAGVQLKTRLLAEGDTQCNRAYAHMDSEIRNKLVKQSMRVVSPDGKSKVELVLIGHDPKDSYGRFAYILINKKAKEMHCVLERVPMIKYVIGGDEILRFNKIVVENRKVMLVSDDKTYALESNGLSEVLADGQSQSVKVDPRSRELINALLVGPQN